MAEEIELEQVELSPPRRAEPDLEDIRREEWTDIAITVRNRSEQTTYYVVASLRSFRYDSATRTLYLGLSEPAPGPEEERTHLMLPDIVPVLPGESQVVRVSVPVRIKQLTASAGLGLQAAVSDISPLEHVSITLQYAETPFRPLPSQARNEVRRALASWGTTIEQRVDRSIPPGERDAHE